ncbi:catalase-related domain-containing protein [Cohnella panacarvi]|uniref:catalase-related domain-containing protein n=1 Tax=Cohnella panacarvi TaxID=400776 RepID=UPI00047EA0F3|nr:catalase-related domain-containing protein [Cohnella panacarvi]
MTDFTTNQDNQTLQKLAVGLTAEQWNGYSDEEKTALIPSLATTASSVEEMTKLRAVCNLYRVDAEYGRRLAAVLNVDLTPYLAHLSQH